MFHQGDPVSDKNTERLSSALRVLFTTLCHLHDHAVEICCQGDLDDEALDPFLELTRDALKASTEVMAGVGYLRIATEIGGGDQVG